MTGPAPSGHKPSLAALHAEKPLRIWSLIVTIFGDLIMDQGRNTDPPAMWVAPLLELLELLGIEGALARTNLSRLVANGTLQRTKISRNTFYRLSNASRTQFAGAANRIYGRDDAGSTSQLTMAVIDRCKDRARARAALTQAGFAMIAPTIGLSARPHASQELPQETIIALPAHSSTLRKAAADAWHLDDINAAYRRFIRNFSVLAKTGMLRPDEAVTARIAMVHQFRRLALRDPHLTMGYLPFGWAGTEARAFFNQACTMLEPAVRQWAEAKGFYRQPPL